MVFSHQLAGSCRDLPGLASGDHTQVPAAIGKLPDAGLKRLGGLTSLDWVILEKSGATEKGVAALKRDLPDCKIWLDLH